MALLELSTSTGLTMEKYHKKLRQNLARTLARLNSILAFKELPPLPSTSVAPKVPPHKIASQEIPMIEEVSEPEGDGSSAGGYTQSYSSQVHYDRKISLPTRIFRRLIPSSVGRKEL